MQDRDSGGVEDPGTLYSNFLNFDMPKTSNGDKFKILKKIMDESREASQWSTKRYKIGGIKKYIKIRVAGL